MGNKVRRRIVRRKTPECFKKEVYELVGDEYTFLETYVNSKTNLKVKHNKCGYVYDVRPNNFVSLGRRCPKCAGMVIRTTEEVRDEIYKEVGEDYILIGDYEGADIKVRLKHKLCGYEFNMRLRNFTRLKRRCPKCTGTIRNNKLKTDAEFKEEVYNLVKDEYTVIGEYKRSNIKVRMRHNKCGYEYTVLPTDFVSKERRCPRGASNYARTTEDIKKEIYEIVGEEHTLVGEYVNSKTPMRVRHNVCGTVSSIRIDNFRSGTRCLRCRESKGERNIREYLDFINIKYEREKTYDDLVNDRPLRYDFYLPDYNLLIEYDGQQHFEHVPYFGTYEQYLRMCENDELKNKYSIDNGINLLRIPYTEEGNEPNIITDYINNCLNKELK